MNDNSLTLAIETASRIGSVAIGRGDLLLAQQYFSGPLRHSIELLPTVKTLTEDLKADPTDIKHIIISIGPGSFTGLRIAVATAKAMALTNDTRITSIGTLDTIAANAIVIGNSTQPAKTIAAVLDAKRNQFFIAGYEFPFTTERQSRPLNDFSLRKILSDSLLKPSEFLDRFVKHNSPVALLGDGLVYHKDKFAVDGVVFLDESTWSPKAEVLYHMGVKKAKAGEFSDPLTLTPFYLRSPQVTLKNQ